jgi:hypothetical protein
LCASGAPTKELPSIRDGCINTYTSIRENRHEFYPLEHCRVIRRRSIGPRLPWVPSDHKGDLSRFLNEAERAHVLELTAAQAKAANVNIGEADLMSIVSEAVHWTREHACASSQTSISW